MLLHSGGGSIQRLGSSNRKLDRGRALEQDVVLLPLVSFASLSNEVIKPLLPCAPAMMYYSATGLNDNGQKPLQSKTKINLSLFKLILSAILSR